MYDLIIKNCRIIDGTNVPWYRGDVAVKDGRIAKIGKLSAEEAIELVDAHDKYLAPGFIDIHSHTDCTILDYSQNESRILQGVTTELGGNCGMSPFPVNPARIAELKDYLRETWEEEPFTWTRLSEYSKVLEERGISTNLCPAVGHGTIRLAVMGYDAGVPDKTQMEEMKKLLRESLDDGAFALTSGLIYPPGSFAQIDEMAELVAELKPYGAFYATHMRNEGFHIEEAVAEALEVCRRTGVPLEISHFKVTRKQKWHTACRETVAMIEKARREEGLEVTADQYPYRASATGLDSNVPEWGFEGGIDKLMERLEDQVTREKLMQECEEGHKDRWGDLYVSYVESEKNAWVVGKSIAEIAKARGVSAVQACFDLIMEERGKVNEINYGMCEEDIEYIMKNDFMMIGSDGNAFSLNCPGRPHPRNFAAFPRLIAYYCRERKLFSLETAISRMSGKPAAKLGLQDRGLIKEGFFADLVLFDFDEIEDTPSFSEPCVACKGIERVYVNGVLTAENGKHTGAKAGKVLRKR